MLLDIISEGTKLKLILKTILLHLLQDASIGITLTNNTELPVGIVLCYQRPNIDKLSEVLLVTQTTNPQDYLPRQVTLVIGHKSKGIGNSHRRWAMRAIGLILFRKNNQTIKPPIMASLLGH